MVNNLQKCAIKISLSGLKSYISLRKIIQKILKITVNLKDT